MKKIILSVAMVLIAVSSFAQFRAGVKGGANLLNINMNTGGVELEIYESRMGDPEISR